MVQFLTFSHMTLPMYIFMFVGSVVSFKKQAHVSAGDRKMLMRKCGICWLRTYTLHAVTLRPINYSLGVIFSELLGNGQFMFSFDYRA